MEPVAAMSGGGGDLGVASAAIRRRPLNPNWAQLQKLLKTRPKPPRRYPSPPRSSALGKRKERNDHVELEIDAPVLLPTSSDSSLTDVLAMDCEMVGVGAAGTKSALGRITLVNAFGNVVFDEFVRPLERVVDFRTPISGIRPKNLRKAKDFFTVQKKVASLIKERTLVGHALHNDLKVLLLSHPKKDIRDTSEYPPFRSDGKRVALRHLASQILGVTIQKQEHCPVEDARAAMFIYQKHKKSWESSIKTQQFSRSNSCRRRKKSEQEGSI